jgi:hypothetical protein
MTSIYPINPSSGGGAPPPVFNISTNGLVPAPGGGASNRVLNANGTWAVPPGFAAQTIVLNPGVTSGTLGSITWGSNWGDPITLTASVTMQVARMNSNVYATSLGANAIDVFYSTSSAQLLTRNSWLSSVTSISFGLYSVSYNCDFYGTILANGSWFQVMGGSSRNTNNSDLLITKLT